MENMLAKRAPHISIRKSIQWTLSALTSQHKNTLCEKIKLEIVNCHQVPGDSQHRPGQMAVSENLKRW